MLVFALITTPPSHTNHAQPTPLSYIWPSLIEMFRVTLLSFWIFSFVLLASASDNSDITKNPIFVTFLLRYVKTGSFLVKSLGKKEIQQVPQHFSILFPNTIPAFFDLFWYKIYNISISLSSFLFNIFRKVYLDHVSNHGHAWGMFGQ